MNYTMTQAKAVATIRAVGSLEPLKMFDGMMRFHGYPDHDGPTALQRRIMEQVRSTDADPMRVRLDRLKEYPRILRVVNTMETTLARHGPVTAMSVDMLGAAPAHPAVQMVLMYLLSRLDRGPPHHDIARAFSVPFKDYGERLLAGELITIDDEGLRLAGRRAIEAY